jgi:hypothetical protein
VTNDWPGFECKTGDGHQKATNTARHIRTMTFKVGNTIYITITALAIL